jgi:hypothetical protein
MLPGVGRQQMKKHASFSSIAALLIVLTAACGDSTGLLFQKSIDRIKLHLGSNG